MTSAQTILVATDLSAPARHAVERAFHLAASTGSELYILHAMELDALDSLREMLGDDVFAVKAALNSDAHRHLDQLLGEVGINRGIAVRTCVAEGNPLATIAAEADALDACLVVLGARGESLLRRALLGPTAARLVRKSSRRPVLVVKQAPHAAYRCVLVAVDFSPVSLQAIRLARQWAPKADLVLLHAFELPYEGKLTARGRRRAGTPSSMSQAAARPAANGCTIWRLPPDWRQRSIGAGSSMAILRSRSSPWSRSFLPT
jgi:nucleotide-binding universal stress UspA family protein